MARQELLQEDAALRRVFEEQYATQATRTNELSVRLEDLRREQGASLDAALRRAFDDQCATQAARTDELSVRLEDLRRELAGIQQVVQDSHKSTDDQKMTK